MSNILTSIKIKDILFKNRIVMSPMCMYVANDGFVSDWHLVHYGSRAVGGVGTIMLEATAVSPEGRIAVGDLGIWKDEHIDGLKKVSDFIKSQGCVSAIQIAHSGRKGSKKVLGADSELLNSENGGWNVISPSAIPFSKGDPLPIEMELIDIQKVKILFRHAAKRALDAGFQLLEIHSAHGYLLHSFLSPVSNKRKDQYGGSIENRSRLLFEIISQVRTVWPTNLPLAVRISATDWVNDGWSLQDSIWISQELAKAGIDIIDVSSGGSVEDATIPVSSGYQVQFSSAIKKVVKSTAYVGAVGVINTAEHANEIIEKEDADFVFLGRELLRNPYFVINAAKGSDFKITAPKEYEVAYNKFV